MARRVLGGLCLLRDDGFAPVMTAELKQFFVGDQDPAADLPGVQPALLDQVVETANGDGELVGSVLAGAEEPGCRWVRLSACRGVHGG